MSAEQLRVGDAERDEVTTALHEHFAQGRLTREELDERLTAALSARTVGDLRAITRDLPGALAATDAGPRGRGPWEMGTAYWGRGRFMAPWPRGGWGPHGRGPLARTAGDEEDGPWTAGGEPSASHRGPAWATPATWRGWGPAPAWNGWGPPRGRPFGPLLLVALIVSAVTGGWWVVLPLLACLWIAVAFRGIRHARRHLTARR